MKEHIAHQLPTTRGPGAESELKADGSSEKALLVDAEQATCLQHVKDKTHLVQPCDMVLHAARTIRTCDSTTI